MVTEPDARALELEIRNLKELMREKNGALEARSKKIKQLERELREARDTRLASRSGLRAAYRRSRKVVRQTGKRAAKAAWIGGALVGSAVLYVKYGPNR